MKMAGLPIQLSATPGGIAGPAPALGEHTGAILRHRLGVAPEATGRLRAEGVM